MESNPQPTSDEARELLGAVGRAEAAVRYPALPWWVIVGNAVLMPLAVLSQLRADYDVPLAPLAIPAVAIFNGLVVARFGVLRRAGRTATSWGTALVSGLLVVLLVASFFIYRATDSAGLVVGAAVLVGLVVLAVGTAYRSSAARRTA